jgi:hypothetical protein
LDYQEELNSHPMPKYLRLFPFELRNNENQKYLLNKKSDIYSVGVLLWEISSGQPPFKDEQYVIALALAILQSLRETIVHDTPEEYVKIYTGE